MAPKSSIDVPEGVTRVLSADVRHVPRSWPYVEARADDVAHHWQRRVAENPGFFNGRILLTTRAEIVGERLLVEVATIDFASFLYWREQGYPDASVADGFGSALILSSDGGLMLARQRGGNLNSGLVYPPGGFMDPRDVADDGTIDLANSIRREIAEETGLDAAKLVQEPGYLVSRDGLQIAICGLFRAASTADDLQRQMDEGLANDPERELAEIIVVRRLADTEPLPMPPWMRGVARALLG